METPPALLPFLYTRFKRAVNPPYALYCDFCFCEFVPYDTFIPDKKLPLCRFCLYDIKYRTTKKESEVEIKK